MSTSKRRPEIDNLKGILILLVVFGHMIEYHPDIEGNPAVLLAFRIISSLHMPLFVYLSGCLTSHADKPGWERKLVSGLLVPFVLFHLFFWATTGDGRTPEGILSPYSGTWYLLSLFFWRLLVRPVSKLRFPLLPACVISVLAGFTSAGSLLSLSRTLAFFPLFLAGYTRFPFDPGLVTDLRRDAQGRRNAVLYGLAAASVLVCAAVIWLNHRAGIPVESTYMRSSYSALGLGNIRGAVARAGNLAVGILAAFACVTLIMRKQTFLTTVGKNSLSVYLLHLVGRKLMSTVGFFRFFGAVSPAVYLLGTFLISVVLCAALGNDLAAGALNRFLGFVSRIFLKDNEPAAETPKA